MSGSIIRSVWVSTANTGEGMRVAGPEGHADFVREDPHGVVMEFGGQQLSIHKQHLALIGRFFLAAAIKLGQDPSEGWDKEQHDQRT